MSKGQLLLRLGLPDGVLLYASRFRELMAKSGAPAALFHRQENGTTGHGAPAIRFVGGRKWVGILADEDQSGIFYQVCGDAIRIASEFSRHALPVNVERHDLEVTRTDTPVRYWVREMAIKRRSDYRRNTDLAALVPELILRGLEDTARRFHIDLPPREDLDIQSEIHRNLGLRLSTTDGPTNEFVTLVDASFDLHAKLEGLWFVGNLTSRGYGRIGRDLKSLAVNYSRETASPRRFVG